MKITNEVIKSLNPCPSRLDNYLKFYKNKEYTVKQFMGLKNITQQDKVWVALRLLDKSKVCFAAADIAESVLHLFEDKYPNDLRPREAIEIARSVNLSPGAANATSPAAYASTWGTQEAASSAAYAASAHAAYFAGNTALAVFCASYAAYFAGHIASNEKIIRTILIKYLK